MDHSNCSIWAYYVIFKMHVDTHSRQKSVLGDSNLKNQDSKLHTQNDQNYANTENKNNCVEGTGRKWIRMLSEFASRVGASFHSRVFSKSSAISM